MKKKLYPRFIAQLIAFFQGYFWLPCPICQKYFAGFEDGGFLMTHVSGGWGVCPDCADEAERINKINFPSYYPAKTL